jgi:hypothetical protein
MKNIVGLVVSIAGGLLAVQLSSSVVQAQSARPLNIIPMNQGCYRLEWNADEYKTHILEGSGDLVTWERVGQTIDGPGGSRSLLFNCPKPRYFFRLREGAVRPGFNALELAPNDDYSSNIRKMPFTVNFLGNRYNQCFINNNGNITFGDNLSVFTPEDLRTINAQILAAFWADVDTRAEGSGIVRYSKSNDKNEPDFIYEYVDGHKAFGATYSDVGHFDLHSDKMNNFQIVIIEREDTGAENFDVEFNYNRIEWESGDVDGENGYGGLSARAGISGRGPKPANQKFAMEIEGSGAPGAFLDNIIPADGPNSTSGLIYRTWNTNVPGRLRFEFRNGALYGAIRVNAGTDAVLPNASPVTIQLHGEVALAGGAGYTVLWTQTAGIPAQIANGSTLTPIVTLPGTGNYTFRLTTSTQTVPRFSSYDEVVVTLEDDTLTANAGAPIQLPGDAPYTFALAGTTNYTGSSELNVAWTQSAGEPAEISQTDILNPEVTLPGPGTYEFTLTATTATSPPRVATSTVTVTHADPWVTRDTGSSSNRSRHAGPQR